MPEKKTLAQFIFDVLSANNTREGYNRGLYDSIHGRTARPGSYRIRPLNYIVGFDHATTTYSGGYNQGYSDGLKVEHGIFPIADSASSDEPPAVPISNRGGNQMPGVQASSETISEVIKEIKTFNDAINDARIRLHNYMDNLYHGGQWSDDQLTAFAERYLGPAYLKVKEAENVLNDGGIDWLISLKNKLEDIENHR